MKALVLGTVKKDFVNDKNEIIEYYQVTTYIDGESVTFKATKEVHEMLSELKDPETKTLTLKFEMNGRAKVTDIK